MAGSVVGKALWMHTQGDWKVGILPTGTANQVSEGPEALRKGSVGVCERPSWRVWFWQLLPGVLDADLAHGGEKAPFPYWVSEKALLNFPSLYLNPWTEKCACPETH